MVSAPGLMEAEELAGHSERVARWCQVLEQRWGRKLDEVIILSRACYDGPLTAVGGAIDEGQRTAPGRLGSRLAQAHKELAEIGAVIEVIATNAPITCARCGQSMPHEWVIEDVHLGKCPDCALDSVRSPGTGPTGRLDHPSSTSPSAELGR